MKKSAAKMDESTFLSMERSFMSEERTILAYIRTELAFLGVLFIVWRFYFVEHWWSTPLAVALTIFFLALLIYETVKIKKLRKQRKDLQSKHKWF